MLTNILKKKKKEKKRKKKKKKIHILSLPQIASIILKKKKIFLSLLQNKINVLKKMNLIFSQIKHFNDNVCKESYHIYVLLNNLIICKAYYHILYLSLFISDWPVALTISVITTEVVLTAAARCKNLTQ
jgi:ABC-type phosphate transport system permease subunit